MTSIISACGSESDSKNLTPFDGIAVIQSSDGASSSMVEFTNAQDSIESGFLAKTATDYAVFAKGEYFYQLGKYNIDTLQKYHIDSPEQGYYPNDGYSLREAGDTVTANPSSMVFVDDDTAVITRYGSTEAWVVNLDPQSPDDFVIKKLDLSHHVMPVNVESGDLLPEADMAFISDNKLFIVLQNLDNWAATDHAMVAVFDTTDWSEIDTDLSLEGVQAIPLTLKNPQSGALFNNTLYIGALVYAPYGSGLANTGGIESIDTSTLTASIITEDVAVAKLTVDSQGTVFFSDYAAWESNTLYKLNDDKSFTAISESLTDINISMLTSPGDSIWLGTNSLDSYGDGQKKNQIIRINSKLDYNAPQTDENIILSKIETALKPISAAFLDIQL